MPDEVQLTLPLVRVLAVMLDHPLQAYYGLELMKRTGLKSGTLYPILARLERAGWFTSEWERDGTPGRPPRKFYRLSEDGMALARTAVENTRAALPEVTRNPRPSATLGGSLA